MALLRSSYTQESAIHFRRLSDDTQHATIQLELVRSLRTLVTSKAFEHTRTLSSYNVPQVYSHSQTNPKDDCEKFLRFGNIPVSSVLGTPNQDAKVPPY